MKLCGFEVGLDRPFFLIAGPCVIESREMAMDTAGELKEMCEALGIPFLIFHPGSSASAGRSANGAHSSIDAILDRTGGSTRPIPPRFGVKIGLWGSVWLSRPGALRPHSLAAEMGSLRMPTSPTSGDRSEMRIGCRRPTR